MRRRVLFITFGIVTTRVVRVLNVLSMRINNWGFIYLFGWLLVAVGIRNFYRKFQITGMQKIPSHKPVIFAGNHQNAFLDGAVLGATLSKPLYFLARADIFKSKIARYLLNGFNALPIYRQRDGGDTIKKNESAFARIQYELSQKHPIVIFPEGNQGAMKHLRPLKKGIFRIAVGAELEYNQKLDVHIVPFGLNYDKHTTMGGDFLIGYGEPIRIQEFLKDTPEDQEEAYEELVCILKQRISALIVDIRETDYYELIHNSMVVFDSEITQASKKLRDKLTDRKEFVAKLESKIVSNKAEADKIKDVEVKFSMELKNHGLQAWLFGKKKQPTLAHALRLFLLLPFHLFGVVNSYLPYRIPVAFINKKVKDVHFHSSIKLTLGVLLFLLFWGTQTVLVAIFTSNYFWVVYSAAVVISSAISFKWWISYLKLRGKFAFNKLRNENNSLFSEMHEQYQELKNYAGI